MAKEKKLVFNSVDQLKTYFLAKIGQGEKVEYDDVMEACGSLNLEDDEKSAIFDLLLDAQENPALDDEFDEEKESEQIEQEDIDFNDDDLSIDDSEAYNMSDDETKELEEEFEELEELEDFEDYASYEEAVSDDLDELDDDY